MKRIARGRRARMVNAVEMTTGGRFSGSLNMCCSVALGEKDVKRFIERHMYIYTTSIHVNAPTSMTGRGPR